MSQELIDFEYFKENQLHYIDHFTGIVNVKSHGGKRIHYNAGSMNPDGYIRIWCNGSLRMQHRLNYYLYHGVLPDEGYEIDHKDKNRANNGILNLRILSKSDNNSRSYNRKFGSQLTLEQVHSICKMLQDTSMSDSDIASVIGRSRATVRDIKKRRSRTSISKDYVWPHRE